MSDFVQSTMLNQTTVESHQELLGKPDTFESHLRQIFGKNKWTWLLPIRPEIRCNYIEMLYTEHQIEEINENSGEFIENALDNPTEELFEEFTKYKLEWAQLSAINL